MTQYVAVNLYKRAIPPAGVLGGERSHQYYTFGHFDGLDIFKPCGSLDSLWSDYKQWDRRIDGSYVSQPLVLAYDEALQPEAHYRDVLGDDINYPFVFLALLNRNSPQFDDKSVQNVLNGTLLRYGDAYGSCVEWLSGITTDLEKEYRPENSEAGRGDFKFACFYPLNISQGAILFKSRSYLAVVHALAFLQRRKIRMGYSFTISGMSHRFVSNSAGIPAGTRKAEGNGRIDVAFDIVISDPLKMEMLLHRELDKRLGKPETGEGTSYETVGCTDVRLIYRDADPARLIEAYRDIIIKGCEKNTLGVSSLVSSWMCSTAPAKYRSNKRKKDVDFVPDKAALKKLGEVNMDRAYLKLFEAAHTLKKSPYSHYINPVIQPALHAFLEILPRVDDSMVIRDSVERFLYQIYSLLSSTLRSDRQFFEAPGFNLSLMETPLKLTAAYNACMYEIRSALVEADAPRQYAFMAVPDLSNRMTSFTLFPNDPENIRLFTVSIPADDMFSFRKIVPQLAHEVAHFACNITRHRKERFVRIVELISRLLVWNLYGKEDGALIEAYSSDIRRIIDSNIKEEKEYQYYLRNYENRLSVAALHAVISDDPDSRDEWRGGDFDDGFSLQAWMRLEPAKEKIRMRKNGLLTGAESYASIENIVNLVLDIAKECFADIVMIIALDMKPEEYLLTFFDAQITADDLEDIHLLERINTVDRVMESLGIWEEHSCRPWRLELPGGEESDRFEEFLLCVRAQMEYKADAYFSPAMKQTIDGYFTLCAGSVRSLLKDKKDLITKKLYRQSFEKEDKDTMMLMQSLLGIMEEE